MKTENFSKTVSTAVFYGSVWGILEATLGMLLHRLPLPLTGSVMFPVAMLLMNRAYKRTGSWHVFILTGVTAALIKLTDVFIPGIPPVKIFNPAAAIIIEASTVAVFSGLISKKSFFTSLSGIMSACLSWRAVFLAWSWLLFVNGAPTGGLVSNNEIMLSFLVYDGLFSSLIALMFLTADRAISRPVSVKPLPGPAISFALFLCGAAIHLFGVL